MVLVPGSNTPIGAVPTESRVIDVGQPALQCDQRIWNFEGRRRRQWFLRTLPIVYVQHLAAGIDSDEGASNAGIGEYVGEVT